MKQLTQKEVCSRGGKNSWKGKSKKERYEIIKARWAKGREKAGFVAKIKIPKVLKVGNCVLCSKVFESYSDKYCKDCSSILEKSSGGRERTREMVRIRDNHTCQKCGKVWVNPMRRFDVHHLNGNCGKYSRSYDRANDLSGMITLCHKCHMKQDEVIKKMIAGKGL